MAANMAHALGTPRLSSERAASTRTTRSRGERAALASELDLGVDRDRWPEHRSVGYVDRDGPGAPGIGLLHQLGDGGALTDNRADGPGQRP